jgi:serine/threonine-protein kinase
MSGPDPLNGQVFDGRYRIIRKLGTGGMANVYLAEDEELGRRVAIKVLDERHTQDEQFVERFRREAKNAAALSHPNIVSIYDRGQSNGTYYIAMEYLEGKTLKELLVTRGPTPIRVAVDYTRQILAALGFAHRHGIVHRDIKPHNVIVGPDGRVKVTDFGIARSGTSQMTETGSIIGTAQYLSPEQARGAPVSPSSDLYSVGIVLYEMLTGAVPFTGDTPLEIAMKHLSTVPDPPSAKRHEVPRDLDLVVLRALAKRPDERYTRAEEMDADLARVAKGLGVSSETESAATAILAGAGIETAATTHIARPMRPTGAYGPPTRTPYYGYEEPIRRRPFWPWVLALLLLAATGFAGYYVYTKVHDQLASSKTIAVQDYRGILERLAVKKIRAANLDPKVRRQPSEKEPAGQVYDQNPDPGTHVSKHTVVTVFVSTGKPKVTVPDVRHKSVDDAVAILAELGAPVAAKLTGDEVRHKSELGALALDLVTEEDVRGAHGRLAKLGAGAVLVERHAPAGAELLVSARRDAVVPSLALGLGGVWTEALADAAVIPLPATAALVEGALRGLRGAALLTGGRGRPELDVGAAARLAADVGRLLLDSELDLVELNPVVVYEEGAVVVDALARTSVPAASPAAVNQ